MTVLHALSLCTLARLVGLGDASAFLSAQPTGAAERISVEAVRQSLLDELAGTFGHGAERLARLRTDLEPLYAALPKGERGGLESPVVRYALHRYFVQNRGWYVNGLQPGGAGWSASAPTAITSDRVPAYIQNLFEERLNGHGFGLRELAAFAATIETLAQQQALRLLGKTYDAFAMPLGPMAVEDVDKALKLHMAAMVLDRNVSTIVAMSSSRGLDAAVSARYRSWPDTSMWALDLRRSVEFAERHSRNPFGSGMDFNAVGRVVQAIGEQFGAFQNAECATMKETLVAMEHMGTGRVRLSTFYSKSLSGHWHFTESVEYLRQLGVLDESDPGKPSVVIPNYLASPGNCLASSSFYSVCCLDECEGLMAHIEGHVAAPSAAPALIAGLVAALPSNTVEAPRNLSAPLLQRLEDIASHHGGLVPLHGRLFSQWMHHAYPRECPFPNVVGTTNPLTPDEWLSQSGSGLVVSREEQRRHAAPEATAEDATIPEIPWTAVEELVGAQGAPLPRRWAAVARLLAFLAAFAALGGQISRAWSSAAGLEAPKAKSHAHFV